jgi:type I restriction enzyme S subunit
VASDWKYYRLGDLIEVKHGWSFKGEFFSDEPTGYLLLTPGNFAIGGGFQFAKPKYYSGSFPEEFILKPGDLIITMTDLSKEADTLGYPALAPDLPDLICLHNQRLGKVIPIDSNKIDLRYLYYVCCLREYRDEILASASGTGVKHTAPERIKRFGTHFPDIDEQRIIANILSMLDDKIELNRRMNHTLEEMARALFKSWFVDFDPVTAKAEGRVPFGMNAETASLFPAEFEGIEEGSIPKGWRMGTVGDAFDLIMGQSPPGETYNEIAEGISFYQGRTDFGNRYPTPRIYCTAPTRFANSGDTLVSVRAPVGDVNMANEKCSIGRGLASIRHKSGSRSFTYCSMLFLKEEFDVFEGEGTLFGSISGDGFRNIKVVIPSPEVVAEFERQVYPLDQSIENNESQIKTLATIRDALLPKLLSGELRVKQKNSDSD